MNPRPKLRKLKHLIRFLASGRGFRDLWEIARYYAAGPAEVIFYASTRGDEIWTRTTLQECRSQGLRCALVVSAAAEPTADIPVYRVSLTMLRWLRTEVLVSASSGIPRWCIPPGSRYAVHMPHSLVSLHAIYPADAFDAFNVIFACGPIQVQEILAMNRIRELPERVALEVGYGKFDLMEGKVPAIERRSRDVRPTVLVAPTWGRNNLLSHFGEALLGALLDRGHAVIVRPHPVLFREEKTFLTRLTARFRALGHFTVEDPVSPGDSFSTADIMISDYSGAAFEFAFLRERPVVFVDLPPKILNPQWQDVGLCPIETCFRDQVGEVVAPYVSAILDAVDRALTSPQGYQSRIRAARTQCSVNQGSCGVHAAVQIRQLLRSAPLPARQKRVI
ncbi:MAG: CDP-glycerol glycerophosphotransferase family protein [Gammaproteobacteria bacterium]|nr:CDP-glycerol glycerophosphotransferase family protein [Gammaproteobacteria bacterium]